ncbi:unnamed protein product [Absidia cylindrospora]
MSDHRKYSPSSRRGISHSIGSDDDLPTSTREKFRRERSLDNDSYGDSYQQRNDEYERCSRSKRYLRSPSPSIEQRRKYRHTSPMSPPPSALNNIIPIGIEGNIRDPVMIVIAIVIAIVILIVEDKALTMMKVITIFQIMTVMATPQVRVMDEIPSQRNSSSNRNRNSSSNNSNSKISIIAATNYRHNAVNANTNANLITIIIIIRFSDNLLLKYPDMV